VSAPRFSRSDRYREMEKELDTLKAQAVIDEERFVKWMNRAKTLEQSHVLLEQLSEQLRAENAALKRALQEGGSWESHQAEAAAKLTEDTLDALCECDGVQHWRETCPYGDGGTEPCSLESLKCPGCGEYVGHPVRCPFRARLVDGN